MGPRRQASAASPIINSVDAVLDSDSFLSHRIWIQCHGQVKFGERYCKSLQAFADAGYRQILWIHTFGDTPFRTTSTTLTRLVREGSLMFKRLATIIPAADLEALYKGDTPVQHIKDLASVKVVFLFGGLYADLKLFPASRASLWDLATSLDSAAVQSDLLFASEPIWQWVGMTARALDHPHLGGVTKSQISLAFFASKCRANAVLNDLCESLFAFWRRRSSQVTQGRTQRLEWTQKRQPLWMHNTQRAHERALSDSGRIYVAPPMLVVPFPACMRSLQTEQHDEHGYVVPGSIDLAAFSATAFIQVWTERQGWSVDLQDVVVAFADSLLSSSRVEEWRLLFEARVAKSCVRTCLDARQLIDVASRKIAVV